MSARPRRSGRRSRRPRSARCLAPPGPASPLAVHAQRRAAGLLAVGGQGLGRSPPPRSAQAYCMSMPARQPFSRWVTDPCVISYRQFQPGGSTREDFLQRRPRPQLVPQAIAAQALRPASPLAASSAPRQRTGQYPPALENFRPGRGGLPVHVANVCRSTPPAAGLQGPIPRTSRGQTIKRPDRLLAIRPLTCTFW